jgi:hypothetical protein
MSFTAPQLITTALFLLIVVLVCWSIMKGLQYGLRRMKLPKELRKKLLLYVGGAIFCWLLFLALLAQQGFWADFAVMPPRILLAIGIPILISITLMFSRFFSVILKAIPMSWLVYIQAFRILMELFLWLGYKTGFVPIQMTFEWLNQDILIGITAPMAGMVFFRRGRIRRAEATFWNISGIVLLLYIALIGMLSAPSPFQIFKTTTENFLFVSEFPFIWIPGFVVPFAIAMHLFSLKQLWMK